MYPYVIQMSKYPSVILFMQPISRKEGRDVVVRCADACSNDSVDTAPEKSPLDIRLNLHYATA